MKTNEIDQLLSGLLGEQRPVKKEEPKPVPEPPKPSAASEKSRRRIEELMRDVEKENSLRKMAEQPRPKAQPLPKREPVVVPPPISHFSEEPSQNPAVRMRDRLDETSLPMIDTERKPTQIIPPKPKEEAAPKKKHKKKAAVQVAAKKPDVPKSSDIPVPQEPPKRKIPHIVVPDELPPDIPREASPADEERRRKIEAAQRAARERAAAARAAAPPAEKTDPAESAPVKEAEPAMAQEPELDAREQEILRKAEKIRKQIRIAMEEIQAVPDPEETEAFAETEIPEASEQTEEPEQAAAELQTEEVPEEDTAEQAAEETEASEPAQEEQIPAEEPQKSGIGGFFRRKKKEPVPEETQPEHIAEEAAFEEETESAEDTEEIALSEAEDIPAEEAPMEEPEAPAPKRKLRHLSEPVEPEERKGLFGFRQRKKKRNLTDEETSDTSEDFPYAQTDADAEEELTEILRKQADFEDAFDEALTSEENVLQDAEEAVLPAVQPEIVPEEEEASINVTLPGEKEKKQKGTFASAIRAALDENVQELADVKAEPLPEKSEIDVALGRGRMHSKYAYFIAGIVCFVFAVIGVIACVIYGVDYVRRFTDNDSLRQELEDVLFPAAVVDLPPFESPDTAPADVLMSAAVIDLLMYEDLSKYTESFDVISIPAADVSAKCAEMFGIAAPAEFVTLHAAGEMFYYDEASGCYNVPASPVIFSYAPSVQEIRRSGENGYVVVVEYLADTAQWQDRSENESTFGEKVMEVTLEKSGDAYQIVRIVNISEESGQGV